MSKLVFEGELDNARSGDGPADAAEGRAGRGVELGRIAVSEDRTGVGELRGVGEVEEFGAEMDAVRFRNRKEALDGEVDVVLAGSANKADAAVAEVLIGEAGSVGGLGGTGLVVGLLVLFV